MPSSRNPEPIAGDVPVVGTPREVIDAARSGAEWAWRELYESLAPQVRGFARARGSRDPDGLVGDVFLNAAEGIDRFDGGVTEFRSWVFTIARRRLIDERRRAGRRRTEPLDERLDLADDVDVEASALAEVRTTELLVALDRLTDLQRDVLILRFVNGMSHAETGRVIGKRENAIKVLQHRAVKALRTAIEAGEVTL